jgi:hypothetical protein
MGDLTLQLVNPDLQAAGLAMIVVTIGIALRIILGSGGRGDNEGRSGDRGGNEKLTHLALSFEKRLMRIFWALGGETRLNAPVIRRSPTLTVQLVGKSQFLIFHPLLRSA